MVEDDVIKFINDKKQFLEEDYKIRYFFDFHFLETNRLIVSNYDTNLEKLSEKLETRKFDQSPKKMKKFLNTNPNKNSARPGTKVFGVANIQGLLKSENFHYKEEAPTTSKEEKENNFLEAFEALVVNKNIFPKKSLILLSQDKHHMARIQKRAPTLTNSSKKRLKAAEDMGIRPITDYFKSTKSSSASSSKKSAPKPFFTYRVEEIIYDLRQDDEIKILFIPASHSELDPMSYTSVFLKSEICRFMRDNREEPILIAIKEMIDCHSNAAWTIYMTLIKNYEDIYIERSEKEKEEIEYDQDERDESDEEPCNRSAIDPNDTSDESH